MTRSEPEHADDPNDPDQREGAQPPNPEADAPIPPLIPASSHVVNLPPPPEYFQQQLVPPPPYSVAAELPTYEEAERSKGKFLTDEGHVEPDNFHPNREHTGLTLFSLPPSGINDGSSNETNDMLFEEEKLGNDFIFFTAFVTAFLFNWVGFLLLMCICHSIAGRYGALSGFGLSLTKWTLIVKRSTELSNESSWLWWMIMAFGLLICVRAVVQYLNIKRSWAALNSAARERLFFFY